MIGPVLFTYGSAKQKSQHLPDILTGATWWCQGFSEPNSGSDLASLSTRARRDGNDYIISGQKIWTSLAQHADMMFCLARTLDDAKRQNGISMLLVDMHQPGVNVRPIITLDGHHHLNEVFLDDVRVPAENLVGEEGKGWTYARFLLSHERFGIANVPRLRRRLTSMNNVGRRASANGSIPLDDPIIRHRVAAFEAEVLAIEQVELRALQRAADGKSGPADASMLKVAGTELLQRGDSILCAMLGLDAALRMPGDPADDADPISGIVRAMLHGRAATIYGGTTEIQLNIIADVLLGRTSRS
jgi:alkylation response protein AidB-like acyl-CoA dehydrogenase